MHLKFKDLQWEPKKTKKRHQISQQLYYRHINVQVPKKVEHNDKRYHNLWTLLVNWFTQTQGVKKSNLVNIICKSFSLLASFFLLSPEKS